MKNPAEVWDNVAAKEFVQWSHSRGTPCKNVWESEGRKYETMSYLSAIGKDSPITKEEAAQALEEEKEREQFFPV